MLKEEPTMTWLKSKVRSYIKAGQKDTAMKFIEIYSSKIKDFNREEVMKLFEKPKKQANRNKKPKERKKMKTEEIIGKRR